MAKPVPRLSAEEIQRVIATAWDDRPPFAAVLRSHGLSPGQVVQLLKRELTANAFKVWKARTQGVAPQVSRPGRRAHPTK
ncbi:MAG: TIGR03643 family protein [Burkholderiaceae bacterium]|nr:TIGR03643 family protein [Burkholderiaceae bacterium]